METMEMQRLRQNREPKSVEQFYYFRVFREDEKVACSVSKELKLTAKKTVEWEAKKDGKASHDAAQRNKVAELDEKLNNFERQPAYPRTAPRATKVKRGKIVRAPVIVILERAAGG